MREFGFAELIDLRHLRVEERSYGVRLVSDRGINGHGDLATALTIGLATAKNCKSRQFAVAFNSLAGDDDDF